MSTLDCYTAALHVGIPLVILTWLGQISIFIIYEMWKHYVGRTQKYSPVHQEERETRSTVLVDEQRNPLLTHSHISPLSPNYSDESESSPEVSPRFSSSKNDETSQVLPNVQQELAGHNLNINSIQENMMALAPLAKQRVEESNLPENQKQLLFGFMKSLDITNPDIAQPMKGLTELVNILRYRGYVNPETPTSNNILDD